MKCSHCATQTPLITSKCLLAQRGKGAHEVNRRAVLASSQIGRAGLVQFCAAMNLPAPITKTSYNEQLKKIK